SCWILIQAMYPSAGQFLHWKAIDLAFYMSSIFHLPVFHLITSAYWRSLDYEHGNKEPLPEMLSYRAMFPNGLVRRQGKQASAVPAHNTHQPSSSFWRSIYNQ